MSEHSRMLLRDHLRTSALSEQCTLVCCELSVRYVRQLERERCPERVLGMIASLYIGE